MLHRASPCNCEKDIGMSKAHVPHFCEHGNLFTYTRQLKRTEGSVGKKSKRRSPLKRGKGFAASDAQRAKVRGLPCVNCGREASENVAIDPGHLLARGQGGCDDPLCVVPLCRDIQGGCHRLFDNGEIDLITKLMDRGYHAELAHMLHPHGLSPTEQVRRLSGDRWEFVERREAA